MEDQVEVFDIPHDLVTNGQNPNNQSPLTQTGYASPRPGTTPSPDNIDRLPADSPSVVALFQEDGESLLDEGDLNTPYEGRSTLTSFETHD